jgi:hypothetical protein
MAATGKRSRQNDKQNNLLNHSMPPGSCLSISPFHRSNLYAIELLEPLFGVFTGRSIGQAGRVTEIRPVALNEKQIQPLTN